MGSPSQANESGIKKRLGSSDLLITNSLQDPSEHAPEDLSAQESKDLD